MRKGKVSDTMKITILDAAKTLNKSPQYIRLMLQQGKFPFGSATKMSPHRWNYVIFPEKFREYVGEVKQ